MSYEKPMHAFAMNPWEWPEARASTEPLPKPAPSALDVQEGGDHYKHREIQPIEYIHANRLPFIEGSIVKYATRHRHKGGAEDVRKIIHYAQLLLELSYEGE